MKKWFGKAIVWLLNHPVVLDQVIDLITKRLQEQAPPPSDPAGHDGV